MHSPVLTYKLALTSAAGMTKTVHASESCMHCTKGDFLHAQYAFLPSLYRRTVCGENVKCGIAAVT